MTRIKCTGFLFLILIMVTFPNVARAEEGEKKSAVEEQAKVEDKEYVTLFTGINRVEEIYNSLREMVPDMKAEGESGNWKKIEVDINQSGKTIHLTFNHDPAYYSGEHWQVQRDGMYNYFSKFPENKNKERALRLIKRLNFAVACVLEPARIKDDERLKLILKLSKKVRAVMFSPGALMDLDGKVIMSLDGYADTNATVDL